MYYSTFQPYIDDKQDKCIVEEKICMICWDGSGNLISLQKVPPQHRGHKITIRMMMMILMMVLSLRGSQWRI